MREALRAWLRPRLGAEHLDGLVLAVSEAAANSVEHAYRGGQRGTVIVRGRLEPSGTVVVTVRDAGRWRPPPPAPGRGLALMRALCADVSVEGGCHGTLVTLRQHDGDPPAR